MIRNPSQPGFRILQSRRRAKYKAALFIFLTAVLLSFITVSLYRYRVNNGTDRTEFLSLWESEEFEAIYRLSSEELSRRPLDFFLLTVHGFSSYQLAIAQINSFNMLTFIDSSIWSLRKALLLSEGLNDGRIFYVLGKAYYYKGPGYRDLTIKYLEEARDLGFNASDIPEYLGLAYASVQDYRSSVAAFALALNPLEEDSSSDALLLAIANSYLALGEDEAALAYLIRCLETSRDFNMIFSGRLSLGDIFFRKGDIDGAEEQYTKVIEESGGNAEAYFRLGEIYNSRGEMVRSRAEWRRAIQIDPSHRLARARLNM